MTNRNQPSTKLLNWLYLDLNSYFATIEQQVNPAIRNKPVAIIPCDADTTCAIAASYEAKRKGVTTGTIIKKAKQLIPNLICVPANHERYVEFHNKIMQEIDKHIYIDYILSIDECACKLTGKYQIEDQVINLAKSIKQGIRNNVGDYISCSIGISTNRFIAKVATEIQKPNGLVVVKKDEIFKKLSVLKLRDLPGIGKQTMNRLLFRGISTIPQLYKYDAPTLGRIFGNINGQRYWFLLRGIELPDPETKSKSIGNSQVLPPELRKIEDAKIIAHRLILKSASRLRRQKSKCKGMIVNIEFNKKSYKSSKRFSALSDSISLADEMFSLWYEITNKSKLKYAKKVAVSLTHIEIGNKKQYELFTSDSDTYQIIQNKRDKLSLIIDYLNTKYGKDTVTIGVVPEQSKKHHTGTKIAFGAVPTMQDFNE